MKLPAAPWLRVVFLATMLLFTAVLVYVYAIRYVAWLDSDASVPALLAAKSLHAMSPIVTDWYYANGDIWVLTPHLIAILPVAILGLGVPALLVSTVLGFALEAWILVKVYLRYGGELWIALLAMMATLMAWSNAHVAYAYVQLAYGFGTVLYLATFYVFATIADDAGARRRRLIAGALLVAVITVSNPTRGAVFLVAPILVGCAWPWRAFPVRRRLALAAAAGIGWAIGYALYTYWLASIVTWSVPRGHVGVVLGGLKQIEANIAMLGRGLVLLCGAADRSVMWAIPGLLILLGALALVVREAWSRAFGPLRWVCVVVLGQLGVVLVPLLIANLLDSPEATRYLMSSLQAIVGLAVLIGVRTAGEARQGWRAFAIVWLAAIPIAAALGATDAAPTTTPEGVWRGGAGRIQPDGAELQKIADELVRRNLTHGFADHLSANLLTLQSHGAALTCHVGMDEFMMPLRWLGSTSCYSAAELPDRFYVVAFQDEHDRSAIRATLPIELERFQVGDTYEVHVFRTADVSLAWLDLPIPDRELATFPMHIPATHLQLRRANVTLEAGELVATGAPGTIVFGPYIDLPKGEYTATWIGSGIVSPGHLLFSVIGTPTGRERRLLVPAIERQAKDIPTGRAELARFTFSAKRLVSGVEVVVETGDGGRVSLHELVIDRAPAH